MKNLYSVIFLVNRLERALAPAPARWLGRLTVAMGVSLILAAPPAIQAAKLAPSAWSFYDFSGTPAGALPVTAPFPGASNQLGGLTDGHPGTFVTMTNPPILLVDMGQTNVLDRVYTIGSLKPTNLWVNYSPNGSTPPLGVILVFVGNSPATTNQVAAYTIPYDAGNPVETEMDLRFSPVAGRFVRLELHTQVTWGVTYWPGYALSPQPPATNVNWNVGEVELYGFTGPAAAQTNLNAVVLPANSAAPLALAASDLSYYLGELTGVPHPIIPPSATNQYSGMLYQIADLAALAPNYGVMMSNINNGRLPNNVNVTVSGKVVTFKAWPYRCVLWSVWEFLERQGVRWVYPDAHGDYVPTNGLNLSLLPLQYTPSATSIYANFDTGTLQPWPQYRLQSVRQENLYLWRNHWNFSWNGYGPLGGTEIPNLPSPNLPLNTNYTEGFVGYPSNFGNVMPQRILAANTNWWPWATTTPGSQVNPAASGAPTFAMDTPSAITWVANKLVNVAAAQPLACSHPLSYTHYLQPFNLLPNDACTYSQDPYTIAANYPLQANPVAWCKMYTSSYSGMYYSFVTGVAQQVLQSGSSALVGALAYSDVFPPPGNLPAFPPNVQMEVCLYGAAGLAMSAPANAGMQAALLGWTNACSHLATYDYALLHTDQPQPDPRLPVPLVAGTVDHAQYLANLGMLNGGCQANLGSLPYNPWNFYAYPRLRWNTNQTSAALEQEFFTGYFREAAAPMLAYYQCMENYQFSNNVNMHYQGYSYNITPGSFPMGVLAGMQTNLAAAQALATNWWVAARVANMIAGFNWVVTNSATAYSLSQDFTAPMAYPGLATSTNLLALSLANMVVSHLPANAVNYAFMEDSGANTWWWDIAGASIQQTFNITAGTYLVNVSARGLASAGIWPIMNLYLGPACQSVSVASTNDASYSFQMTVPGGIYDLALTFNNAASGGARQLKIDGLRVAMLPNNPVSTSSQQSTNTTSLTTNSQ